MSLPDQTVAGVATVLKARSACEDDDATTSVAVAELAPKAWFVALTVAVSVIMVPLAVPAFTWTTSVTVPLDPAGADTALQFMAPIPPTAGVVQVVPGGAEIEKNVVLTGVFSLNVALLAATLPTFVAVCV